MLIYYLHFSNIQFPTQVRNNMTLRNLRHYQVSSIDETCKFLEEGFKKVCILLDTGTGKTLTAKGLLTSVKLRRALGMPDDAKLKVLWIVHRETLLEQASRDFIDCENVEFIPQMMSREIPEGLVFHIIVQDEAHHEPCHTFQKMLPRLDGIPQIGLTAEVDRGDNRLLKYDRCVSVMDRETAENEGWILRPDVHTVLDTGCNMVQSVKKMNKQFPELFPRTVVFLRTISEGLEMIEYFKTQINPTTGEYYRVCDGVTQKGAALSNSLDLFSSEYYDIIVTCNKLGEGVDMKNVQGVVIARNINTKTLLNQIVGRAVRIDVKVCRVIEFINPYIKNLNASDVVGATNSHFLYNFRNNHYQKNPYQKKY